MVKLKKQIKMKQVVRKKQCIIELTDESEQLKVHNESQTEKAMQKKEEVRVYQPPIPFP